MKKPKVSQNGKVLDYSPFFIIDEYNAKGDPISDIKTPFGRLTKDTILILNRYGLNIEVKIKDEKGWTYTVSKIKAAS